jgi:hypothetical protein
MFLACDALYIMIIEKLINKNIIIELLQNV